MSQKAETGAPKIERRLRNEIGSGAPLDYTIENGEAHSASVGSLLGDVGAAPVRKERGALFLFRLNFQLPPPRPAALHVSVARQGFGLNFPWSARKKAESLLQWEEEATHLKDASPRQRHDPTSHLHGTWARPNTRFRSLQAEQT